MQRAALEDEAAAILAEMETIEKTRARTVVAKGGRARKPSSSHLLCLR